MKLQQISFKNNLQAQAQRKNVETNSSVPALKAGDTINISTKTDKKKRKGSFEKISLGILATAALTGIGLFAFRRNIAKNIWYRPEEYVEPLKGLRDDTLQQATECISDKFHNLEFKAKTLEEILALKKYAKSIEDIHEYAKALERKLTVSKDSKKIIEEFVPITESYFNKVDKLEHSHPGHIEALAYAYDKEGMPDKAYDLLLKADEKWRGENFGVFKSSLIDLYSSNGKHETAIKIWESVSDKEIPNYRRESTCLIPVTKSYIKLNKIDKAIDLYKKYGNVQNEELSDIYVDIMSKQGKEKNLLKELFAQPYNSRPIVQLLDRNLAKLKLDNKYNEIINNITKSLEAEKNLPISGWEKLEEKHYKNIELILETTKKLKGNALPSEYADEMIKVLQEILDTADPMEASKKLEGLTKFNFYSIEEKYPAYQWLKENLAS